MSTIERRRGFIFGLGALACVSAFGTQSADQVRRVALLMGTARGNSKDSLGNAQAAAFRDALRLLGWIEGQNLRIDYRWGEGDVKLMRSQADELVAGRPEIIFAQTATALREVQRAAGGMIPIVFWNVSDPVGNKFVQSLSRPGGNTTGFSLFEYEMGGKWLQILKEVAPRVRRVLLLMNVRNPNWPGWRRAIESAGQSLGLSIEHIELTETSQIGPAVAAFARKPNGGLVVLPDPFLSQREAIAALAAKHRLPAIYGLSEYTKLGGLISYGIDRVDLPRRAASYADRILKGEKPGDLPIQKPTKFELEVNLATAKTLGLQIPQTILLRADRVIE